MRKNFFGVIVCLSIMAATLAGCGKNNNSAASGRQVVEVNVEAENPTSTPDTSAQQETSQADPANNGGSNASESEPTVVTTTEAVEAENPDVANGTIENGYYVYVIDGYTFRIRTNLDEYLYHREGKSSWSVDLKGIALANGFIYPYEGDGAAPLERQVRFEKDGWSVYFDGESNQAFYDVIHGGRVGEHFHFSRNDLDNDSVTTYWIGNRSEESGKLKVNFEQIVIYTYLLENYDNPAGACDEAGIDSAGIIAIDR